MGSWFGAMGRARPALLLSLLLVTTPASAVGPADPAFIVGYATAALERNDLLEPFTVDFEASTLMVFFDRTPDVPFDAMIRQMTEIEGVEQAQIYVAGELVASARAPDASGVLPGPTVVGESDSGAAGDPSTPPDYQGYDFFLLKEMFDPLLADPRWPHFSASHLWFLGDDDELERVGAANFGETFVFVRSPKEDWGRWEFGFQAGVFSVFDLEASSADLVNSDFLVGLTFTHHIADLTVMTRIYHQSSHLGDEYLLRNRVDRVNLSFEVLDLLASFEPVQWLRVYGGGGVIVHREPAIDRGILQAGVELSSPVAFASGYLRPVAGTDLQFRQESDWKTDASVRAGVQIEHPFLRRSLLRVLGEFYSGRSPNGQFYERRIKTIGLGVHLSF